MKRRWHLELAVAGVNHVDDAVHSQTGLSNVGGHHHLAHALRRLLKDLALQVCWQLGVDGQDEQRGDPLPQVIQALLYHHQGHLSSSMAESEVHRPGSCKFCKN